MSDVAEPRTASLAGVLVVLLFVAFALAGPVIIVRDRLRAGTGAAQESASGGAGGGGNAGPTPGSSTQASASPWSPPPASTTSAASIRA
jgi:hypothetical protein